ncbi:P-loop ATPase, Sll1717 family, partial [Micromonospora sp. CPCC 205558]|uniref:P-loop ATPase, Sll1717 family n=1 Tax=Micromonospora sp. CPCC 205558 TaxID=3122403 RepID=UPI002FF17733
HWPMPLPASPTSTTSSSPADHRPGPGQRLHPVTRRPLAGNWILQLAEGDYTDDMRRLETILKEAQLRSHDDSAPSAWERVVRFLHPRRQVKAAEAGIEITPEGLPSLTGRVELEDRQRGADEKPIVRHDDALRLLNRILDQCDITMWLAVDRLDEAFQGNIDLERSALRALFRSYLDMKEFGRIRLKLFVRRDLFRRITVGGFVNLTHVNDRKVDIMWDNDDLFSLLQNRVKENHEFLRDVGLNEDSSPEEVFYTLFPEKVDHGNRKPTTWTWMILRVRDGNNVKPPRNLIDLARKAREAQLRYEERYPKDFEKGTALITSEAVKAGLDALSEQRVEDTLIAEAGAKAHLIDYFRYGKAEHNIDSLQERMGEEYSQNNITYLTQIGFLEKVGGNYKIPALYRAGLGVTQGKAFASSTSDSDEA